MVLNDLNYLALGFLFRFFGSCSCLNRLGLFVALGTLQHVCGG